MSLDVKMPRAFIASLAILAVSLPATQAAAGPPPFKVKAAKAKDGPYKAEDQRLKIAVGSAKSLYWRVAEKTGADQQLTLDQPGSIPAGYKVRWFRGNQNITAAVTGVGYAFVLKADARRVFRARVKREAAGSPFCLGGQFNDAALPYADGAYFKVNDLTACN